MGDKAPDFTLPDDKGEPVKLSQFRGQPVVLYFYPEDDTPGCTVQACGFRDDIRAFEELDAVVIGVSPDPPESHARFRAKFRLPFILLADPQRKAIERYGAWGEKSMMGNQFVGLIRSTIVISPEGRIAGVFRNVRTEGHSQRMLEQVRKLVA
ncbi:MAG: thioredoxin-dependent peroxiredoxin [Thermoplasmata archaeon]|nr:thioredoxin-dependent peroxiredoxin [Thermoplasmata archaeon]